LKQQKIEEVADVAEVGRYGKSIVEDAIAPFKRATVKRLTK